MKDVVAALLLRTEPNQRPTQEALMNAVEYARSHGLVVDRVGRRHLTVRANRSALATALGVLPIDGGHVEVHSTGGDAAKYFSAVEIAKVPVHF